MVTKRVKKYEKMMTHQRLIFMPIGAARALVGDGFNGVADVDNFLNGIPPV